MAACAEPAVLIFSIDHLTQLFRSFLHKEKREQRGKYRDARDHFPCLTPISSIRRQNPVRKWRSNKSREPRRTQRDSHGSSSILPEPSRHRRGHGNDRPETNPRADQNSEIRRHTARGATQKAPATARQQRITAEPIPKVLRMPHFKIDSRHDDRRQPNK